MKKLVSTLLTLVMLLALTAPALAAEFEELDPPLWQALRYSSREAYMEASSLTAEEYIAQTEWLRAYLSAHPEEDAGFDAAEYYENVLCGGKPLIPLESWIEHNAENARILGLSYTEADFAAEMKADWLQDLWRDYKTRLHWDALVTLYPEDYAVFDADAWYSAYYIGHAPLAETKEEFMRQSGLSDEEDFRRQMFAYCVDGTYTLGHYALAVNGVPMDFFSNGGATPLRMAGTDILLVPVRTVGESFGYTVSWQADTQTITVTDGTRSAVFAGGSAEYTLNGQPRTLPTEVFAYDGRSYVALDALAELIGFTWTWNTPYSAVFIHTGTGD